MTESVDANDDAVQDSASSGLANLSTSSTTYRGTVSLESSEPILLTGTNIGVTGLDDAGNTTTTIDQVDISTREGAVIAISSVDSALSQIDVMRGDLGAVQNRFESTIANLITFPRTSRLHVLVSLTPISPWRLLP